MALHAGQTTIASPEPTTKLNFGRLVTFSFLVVNVAIDKILPVYNKILNTGRWKSYKITGKNIAFLYHFKDSIQDSVYLHITYLHGIIN
jgi:hypothetical protein